MEKVTKGKRISLILLSIMLPVTLTLAFRMVGVSPEPQTPQIINVEAVSLKMIRPRCFSAIDEEVSNSFVDDVISLKATTYGRIYRENAPYPPFDGGDGLSLYIKVAVNVSKGFIYSVTVRFSKTDAYSLLCLIGQPDYIELRNLMLESIEDPPDTRKREAYISALGINYPEYASLGTTFYWLFFDKNNMDHAITVTIEVTYFNGSTWYKIATPFRLEVLIS